jgi:riboflavin synthase
MFTGIITDIGTVLEVDTRRGDQRLRIGCGFDMSAAAIGASIACAGCCLTVVEKGADWFCVDVSAETLSKTTLGEWRKGTNMNLERALRAGDELGGHFVSGHVDGLAVL